MGLCFLSSCNDLPNFHSDEFYAELKTGRSLHDDKKHSPKAAKPIQPIPRFNEFYGTCFPTEIRFANSRYAPGTPIGSSLKNERPV